MPPPPYFDTFVQLVTINGFANAKTIIAKKYPHKPINAHICQNNEKSDSNICWQVYELDKILNMDK